MRTHNLLEKGLESRDASIFQTSVEDLDKLITEHEAASQIINEHRTLHFFLLVLYTIVVFGVNAHFLIVAADFKNENTLCLVLNPSSYSFLLGFGLLSITASIMAIRRSTRKLMDDAFFARQRCLFTAMLLCTLLMALGLVLGDKACKRKRSPSRWCFAWAVITGAQALLLRSYSGWVDRELTNLRLLAESSRHVVEAHAQNEHRTPEVSFEAPTVSTRSRQPSQDKSMDSGNLSLNSITTV